MNEFIIEDRGLYGYCIKCFDEIVAELYDHIIIFLKNGTHLTGTILEILPNTDEIKLMLDSSNTPCYISMHFVENILQEKTDEVELKPKFGTLCGAIMIVCALAIGIGLIFK